MTATPSQTVEEDGCYRLQGEPGPHCPGFRNGNHPICHRCGKGGAK